MLPDWYGISGIGFEYRGAVDDPLLHYKGRTLNANAIQDAIWDSFVDETGILDDGIEWENYVRDKAISYLDDIIDLCENQTIAPTHILSS